MITDQSVNHETREVAYTEHFLTVTPQMRLSRFEKISNIHPANPVAFQQDSSTKAQSNQIRSGQNTLSDFVCRFTRLMPDQCLGSMRQLRGYCRGLPRSLPLDSSRGFSRDCFSINLESTTIIILFHTSRKKKFREKSIFESVQDTRPTTLFPYQ